MLEIDESHGRRPRHGDGEGVACTWTWRAIRVCDVRGKWVKGHVAMPYDEILESQTQTVIAHAAFLYHRGGYVAPTASMRRMLGPTPPWHGCRLLTEEDRGFGVRLETVSSLCRFGLAWILQGFDGSVRHRGYRGWPDWTIRYDEGAP